MLAQLYQAHHSRYNEDLPFWLDLASRQGSPILELGCGTGRVLLPLARAGYDVFGLDHDTEMLALLQTQAVAEGASRGCFFQADMGAFHFARPFALILLPCNTLSTLAPETRRLMLACTRQHLASNGLFAASLPNPALLKRLPPQAGTDIEDIFPHPTDGEPVQASGTWQRHPGSISMAWHYDHLLPDGRVERLTAQTSHTLQPAESYAGEFRQAGLRVEGIYGDFDRSPYTEDSPSLILLAQAEKI
jgi:SAM-dependent methyltransferase